MDKFCSIPTEPVLIAATLYERRKTDEAYFEGLIGGLISYILGQNQLAHRSLITAESNLINQIQGNVGYIGNIAGIMFIENQICFHNVYNFAEKNLYYIAVEFDIHFHRFRQVGCISHQRFESIKSETPFGINSLDNLSEFLNIYRQEVTI